MSDLTIASGSTRFGDTDRKDLWWLPPLSIFLGLSAFIVYATFRVFYNADYVVDNASSAYLLIPVVLPSRSFYRGLPAWISPAMLVLWAPGGFRLTCYYYTERPTIDRLLWTLRHVRFPRGKKELCWRNKTFINSKHPSLLPLPGAGIHRDPFH